MATAQDAVDSALTYLNDVNQQIWTDAILIPFLKEAYRDLLLELGLQSIPVIREKSSALTVTAGDTTLSSIPDDLIEPIRMKERKTSNDSYINMEEKAFEPDFEQTDTLRYWAWRDETIEFVGATSDAQVLLFYWKTLTIPTAVGSNLNFINAEIFLGPRLAAYAANSVGNKTLGEAAFLVSESKLDKIIRTNVKGQQSLPTRRIPYRRARRTRVFSF